MTRDEHVSEWRYSDTGIRDELNCWKVSCRECFCYVENSFSLIASLSPSVRPYLPRGVTAGVAPQPPLEQLFEEVLLLRCQAPLGFQIPFVLSSGGEGDEGFCESLDRELSEAEWRIEDQQQQQRRRWWWWLDGGGGSMEAKEKFAGDFLFYGAAARHCPLTPSARLS